MQATDVARAARALRACDRDADRQAAVRAQPAARRRSRRRRRSFPSGCRRSCSSAVRTSPSAERRVAEANEQVGIARTSFFPSVMLNAAGGFEGNTLANWFAWPSRFWAIGPAAVQTIFDGGKRRAVSEAATGRLRRDRRGVSPGDADRVPAGRRQSGGAAHSRAGSAAAGRGDDVGARSRCASRTIAISAAPIRTCRCSPRRRSRSPTNATTSTSCAGAWPPACC